MLFCVLGGVLVIYSYSDLVYIQVVNKSLSGHAVVPFNIGLRTTLCTGIVVEYGFVCDLLDPAGVSFLFD